MIEAKEAAQRLGVSVNTLYAYVSRGMLRSHSGPGPDRRRLYDPVEVEQLLARRGRAEEATRSSLDWGLPVLQSEICCIEQGRLFYRGVDVIELARDCSSGELAAHLWLDDRTSKIEGLPSTGTLKFSSPGSFVNCTVEWLGAQREFDPASCFLETQAVCQRGWTIFGFLRSMLPPVSESGQAWLESALVLLADHELNSSTFTARVVASTGADPYAVVCAALMTLTGPRHGGACFQVEGLLDEGAQKGARATIESRLRRGEAVPGFGHRLYPQGDPRALYLLSLLPDSPWIQAGQDLLGLSPSVDFALVHLCRCLNLPDGSAFQLFATARCLGWIAHALEQYRSPVMLRPRADYVGRPPKPLATVDD